MALKYVKRFYTVCYLVLFLVISAVADISLDYILGNEEPLRSSDHILTDDCGSTSMRHHCYQKCGANHACLLGQCFCVKVRTSSEAEEDKDITEEESSVEKHIGARVFYQDEADEEETPHVDEELVDQPSSLRHHIAHFCPNLDEARQCIRKCMKLGLPAFCGKDHICYCGHKNEDSHSDPKADPAMVRNQFKDLYEKYFGPNFQNKKRPRM